MQLKIAVVFKSLLQKNENNKQTCINEQIKVEPDQW